MLVGFVFYFFQRQLVLQKNAQQTLNYRPARKLYQRVRGNVHNSRCIKQLRLRLLHYLINKKLWQIALTFGLQYR